MYNDEQNLYHYTYRKHMAQMPGMVEQQQQ